MNNNNPNNLNDEQQQFYQDNQPQAVQSQMPAMAQPHNPQQQNPQHVQQPDYNRQYSNKNPQQIHPYYEEPILAKPVEFIKDGVQNIKQNIQNQLQQNQQSVFQQQGLEKLRNVKGIVIKEVGQQGCSDLVFCKKLSTRFVIYLDDPKYSELPLFQLDFNKPNCTQDDIKGEFSTYVYDHIFRNPNKEKLLDINHDRNQCCLKGFLSLGLCFGYYFGQLLFPPQTQILKNGHILYSLEYNDFASKVVVLDNNQLSKYIIDKDSMCGSQVFFKNGQGIPVQDGRVQCIYKNRNNFKKLQTKITFPQGMHENDKAAVIIGACKLAL